jgi:hypothetical protein
MYEVIIESDMSYLSVLLCEHGPCSFRFIIWRQTLSVRFIMWKNTSVCQKTSYMPHMSITRACDLTAK